MAKATDEPEKAKYEGDRLIALIRNLIRYDIPVLILGKSSIGKSFTMITIANKYKMPHQLLYVGSEKSEHIEGLPKLTGLDEKTKDLEYLKPYWFPKGKIITQMVANGRDVFNKWQKHWNPNTEIGVFNYSYNVLSKILELFGKQKFEIGEKELITDFTQKGEVKNNKQDEQVIEYAKPFILKREVLDLKQEEEQEGKQEVYQKDDLRDVCVYLCTLLGYGNFWLMLDEIDKVEEGDTDKFAPLLHIVRERWLKKWKLREINGGEGVEIPEKIENSKYLDIDKMIEKNLALGNSVLDTRVIAIANKTENLEEALFRRFCQVIITDLLFENKPDPIKSRIKLCIDDKFKGIDNRMEEGLEAKKIEEVNLQWTLGFFNKMLNDTDKEGNYIVQDYRNIVGKALQGEDIKKDPAKYELAKTRSGMTTLLYKIITDNFEDESDEGKQMVLRLFDCLSSQINIGAKSADKTFLEQVEAHFIEMSNDSDEDKKDAIVDVLDTAYPKRVSKDKQAELREWVEKCYTYLNYTMFDKNKKFKQTDLNKLLIPSIQKLIYRKLTNDDTIGTNDVTAQLKEIAIYWQDIMKTVGLPNIKADKDEVQRALYGGTIAEMKKQTDAVKVTNSEDSIFGAGSYMTNDVSKVKAFDKSLASKILLKQKENVVATLKQFSNAVQQADGTIAPFKITESPNYDSFIRYVKSEPKVLKFVQDQIDELKKGKVATVVAVGSEMEKIIK